MKKAILQMFTAILVLGLFCGTVTAAPSIIEPGGNSTVNKTVGESLNFSVKTNESTQIDWFVNGVADTSSSYDTGTYTSTLPHTVRQGTYDVKATVHSTGESRTWRVTGEANKPIITLSDPSNSNVKNNVGESRRFTATVNQRANMAWSLDGTPLYTNTSVTESSYTNNSATKGTHIIKVDAENGTTDTKSWTWEVSADGVPINVDPSEGTIKVSQGKSQTFSISSSQNIKVEWLVNNITQETNQNVPSSSYEFKGNTTGEYTLKAVVSDPNGVYSSSTPTWTVKVGAASSGNRIWEKGMPATYTWDAQSYSGFYYDLDSGVSSEKMTIEDIGRNIDKGNIKYVTSPTETDFDYKNWGSYQVIGFMAEKYFAGYSKQNSTVIGDDVSLISDGILAKILTDSNDKKSANSGEALVLEEGYSLNIKEVDVNGNSVWVQLEKDGNVVDEGFVSSGQDYVYKTDLGKAKDVPLVIVRFGSIFSGTETSAVFVQGIFQISDKYTEVKSGDTFGKMEVKSISSDEITMENSDNVGLDEGETIDLMGKIKLQVADNSVLRFAPILDTSEAGTYELRGTVYDKEKNNESLTWTPFNFEGFYYNLDEGIGTEELKVEDLKGRNIPSKELVYQSTPQPVKFEHSAWGNFTVIGFMADKYFAGYQDGAVNGEIDDVSLLSENILSKVLIDTDDKKSMYSGSALTLENGYSLSVKEVDVNGNSVWVQLEKDGKVVDDGFVSSGQDYVYKTDIGSATNVPMIIAHFGTVFSGTETSAVFVQGIFQLSDDYTEIKNGDTFGKMEVSSVSESGITMKNSDSIGLDQGETTEIMGNISFKTADDSTLRFYPFVKVETGLNTSTGLKISVPDELGVGDTFNIGVTAGESPVEGADVKVNATSVGKTDANGTVGYTAKNVGSMKLTAEKEGYTTANKNINVTPPKEKMTVNILPEKVYIGDTIKIEAVKAIGGDPIEGANVSINGNFFNKTGPDGKATYKTDKNGTLKLSVTKQGFVRQDIDIKVRDFEAIFKFSNLIIDPLEVSVGKDATISVDVENIGNAAGNKSVELYVNENVTDSKNISLDVGKNTTVTFKHNETVPGNYTVKVGGETATYTVKEKSSLLLYALIAIVLLIIGGVAYYFTKGGGDMAMLQEKVKELINSVNPKK